MSTDLIDPGKLALKAALAAPLALVVVDLLSLPDRLSAAFVAVACISPTVYSGVRRGLDQLGASVLGGVITWAIARAVPHPTVAVGLATFVTLYGAFALGMGRGYVIAAFTVAYVELIPGPDRGLVLEYRLLSVLIGMASAMVVNVLVSLVSYRPVFARRLAICRSAVATHFERLAAALEGDRAVPLSTLYDEPFILLRTLLAELNDGVRESSLRSARGKASLKNAQQAAEWLVRTAHHGKDVAIALERAYAPDAASGALARRLAEAVRGAAPMGPLDETARAPLQLAVESWNQAHAREAAFKAG